MCEEGWCDKLGHEGDCFRERGGNFMKYLERGVGQKKGSGNKDFKMRRGRVGHATMFRANIF